MTSRGLLLHDVGSHPAKKIRTFSRGYTFTVKIDTFGFVSIYHRLQFEKYNRIISYGGSFTMRKPARWIACTAIAASRFNGVAIGAGPSTAKHPVYADYAAALTAIVV